MGDFREAQPSNRVQGESGAPDNTTTLFSEAYISGVPLGTTVPAPPPMLSQTVDESTSELNEPNWVDVDGGKTPAAKESGPSNGRWYYWDGSKSLAVQLHNNNGILSVWLPQEPPQVITVQSGMGAAGGIGIYNTTPYTAGEQVASEIIAIPSGHESLVLTAAAAFTTPIFVLVSGEPYPPEKTFLSTITASSVVSDISFEANPLTTFNLANAGGVPIIAGIAGKRIYVFAYDVTLIAHGAVNPSMSFGLADSITTLNVWSWQGLTSAGSYSKTNALNRALFCTSIGAGLTTSSSEAVVECIGSFSYLQI